MSFNSIKKQTKNVGFVEFLFRNMSNHGLNGFILCRCCHRSFYLNQLEITGLLWYILLSSICGIDGSAMGRRTPHCCIYAKNYNRILFSVLTSLALEITYS